MIYYLERLINDIPQFVYEGLLSVFCIGSVLLLVWKRGKSFRLISKLLLIEYISVLYGITVIFRENNNERRYDYTPFWSYDRPDLYDEIIMNILVFVPIGLLLSYAIKGINWWKVFLVGFGISLSIELLQLLLKRGFSEVDDVIHNTLGCMMGYLWYSLVIYGYERVFKRHETVNYREY